MLPIYLFLSLIILWLIGLTVFLYLYYHPKSTIKDLTTSPHMRTSLVRFNPFSDTGGEQSFVLSLLDGGGNGILITSLHGRGITRIYAKRVKKGTADQELSAEEKAALNETLK